MALSPTQLAWRGRVESGLRFAAPFLDLLLLAGDRLSRALEPRDVGHIPARPVGAIADPAPRAVAPPQGAE